MRTSLLWLPCGVLAFASHAAAQSYPSRPIKVIIPASAGGTQDVFMRALGEDLRKRLGQTLVIENRPGGNFNIGARACADSAAGRLHHLHAAERGAGLQQAPVQEDSLRPGEGFRADHQSVLRDAGDRGECRSQGEKPRGAR